MSKRRTFTALLVPLLAIASVLLVWWNSKVSQMDAFDTPIEDEAERRLVVGSDQGTVDGSITKANLRNENEPGNAETIEFESADVARNTILNRLVDRKIVEAEAKTAKELLEWIHALGLSERQARELGEYYIKKLENKELHLRLAFSVGGASWSTVKSTLEENANREMNLDRFMKRLLNSSQKEIYEELNMQIRRQKKFDLIEKKIDRMESLYGLNDEQKSKLVLLYNSENLNERIHIQDGESLSASDRYIERQILKMERELEALSGILNPDQIRRYAESMESEIRQLDAAFNNKG